MVIAVRSSGSGSTRQLWVWQKKKNKQKSDFCPQTSRDHGLLQILAAATRTQDIKGWFSAWCLPPGLEKSHSGAAVRWEAGPLM